MNSAKQNKTITVALAGNPNCGKTTIFNNLTGSKQKVGNYGGVTVDVKTGSFKHDDYTVKVIDLPGTYSLTAYSIEEIVARDYIIKENPDVVIDIIDGSNFERNLYLTAQLKELGVPLVTVINMSDEMKAKGLLCNKNALSAELGCPTVETIGVQNKGTKKLVKAVIEVADGKYKNTPPPPIHYGNEVETEIAALTAALSKLDLANNSKADSIFRSNLNLQWLALKLLENDMELLGLIENLDARKKISETVRKSQERLAKIYAEDPEMVIAEQRYGYVRGLYNMVIKRIAEAKMDFSAWIDKVLTNRVLGLPIFAAMMYLTFWLVFTVGQWPMFKIEWLFETFTAALQSHWPAENLTFLRSLIIDGVIAGVGGVLVFLPNIVLLFTAISLLEDTGYMARAAFIMDRLMKWVGLHGKSFIPMLTGFGCTVPAIMSTRILDNRRDRLTTIMILPLMSCGARLPIYMLIIPTFFEPTEHAAVMFTMYLIGVVISIICAKLLRKTLFKGEASPFVMELPPYRIPTARAVWIHVWQRARLYLRKAGTVILAFSILMWALATYPKLPDDRLEGLNNEQAQEEQLQNSISGRIGKAIAPIIKPTMGFDWKIGAAIIGAFPAKELFVAQMGIVYSLGEVDEKSAALSKALKTNYDKLTGFCIMLFCLISSPCMATVAVTRRETGSWAWAALQLFGLTLIAFILTTIAYHTGTFLNIGVRP